MGPAAALRDWDAGLPKVWMIRRVLRFRAEQPQHFTGDSNYQPITASGARLSNIFAFRRGKDLIAVMPSFGVTVKEDWQDTVLPLPDGRWINLLGAINVAESATPDQLFAEFPVALLVRANAVSERH